VRGGKPYQIRRGNNIPRGTRTASRSRLGYGHFMPSVKFLFKYFCTYTIPKLLLNLGWYPNMRAKILRDPHGFLVGLQLEQELKLVLHLLEMCHSLC